MSVNHALVSAVPDDGVAGEVGPSEWNADHVAPPFAIPFLCDASAAAWTNMPAAAADFRGVTHQKVIVDLTNVDEVQLTAYIDTVAPFAGSRLFVEYATNLTAPVWAALAAAGDVEVSLGSAANVGVVGAWTAIAAGAKTGPVMLRLRGSGGNGTADPNFGPVILWAK